MKRCDTIRTNQIGWNADTGQGKANSFARSHLRNQLINSLWSLILYFWDRVHLFLYFSVPLCSTLCCHASLTSSRLGFGLLLSFRWWEWFTVLVFTIFSVAFAITLRCNTVRNGTVRKVLGRLQWSGNGETTTGPDVLLSKLLSLYNSRLYSLAFGILLRCNTPGPPVCYDLAA